MNEIAAGGTLVKFDGHDFVSPLASILITADSCFLILNGRARSYRGVAIVSLFRENTTLNSSS